MQEQRPGKSPGDVLGDRYRIVSVIGNGGMSTVYLADDLRLAGKRWAVKETRPTGEEVHASLAEAEMLIRLNHPNLPEIVDCFPADGKGYSYLVMDYIEGETLLQRFERQARRMPEVQVIGYALQLCDLFQYLHSCRPDPIIYRDLKPTNLMIDMEERVRLIDFGIARSFKPGQRADTVRIGTVGFAAPEQFEGRQTDARTDLYGLGALLYFLLSGGHYYCAAYKRLSEHDAGLSAGLAALVEKLLQAEPEARCQSAAEVRSELERVLAGQHGQSGASAAARGQTRAGAAYAGGEAGAALPPRIVAVGALYAGAGATFAALAIARALHGLGVPHAVLELPGRQPELYALLYGEKHAPAGYCCYNEAGSGRQQEAAAAWADGNTLWLPAKPLPLPEAALPERAKAPGPPAAQGSGYGVRSAGEASPCVPAAAPTALPGLSGAGRVADASAAATYHPREPGSATPGEAGSAVAAAVGLAAGLLQELFDSPQRPVILVDIGSEWQEPAAHGLLGIASELIYIVDPLLHKLELASTRRNLRLLGGLRQSGKPVHGIANKAVASSRTGHWLRVLPEPPVCLLPAMDQAKLAEASWLGVLAQERPGVRQPLNRALRPWLRQWLPEVRRQTEASGTKRMLHKLLNNG